MEEIEELLLEKYNVYKNQYILADEAGIIATRRLYGKKMRKIAKMLVILNK